MILNVSTINFSKLMIYINCLFHLRVLHSADEDAVSWLTKYG